MKLFEDGSYMGFDGALRNAKCPCNFLIAGTSGQSDGNFLLSVGKPLSPSLPIRGRREASSQLNSTGRSDQSLH